MASGSWNILSIAASSQDIWYEPSFTALDNNNYVVYMVPGNPCIMTYYQPFLSELFFLLNNALAPRNQSVHVGGYTLPGFRLQPDDIDDVVLPTSFQSQIGYTEKLIKVAIKKHVDYTNGDDSVRRPKVILVAHSAGTYITLELLKRYANGHDALSVVDIIGAVLICPTISHLADESKNGAVANVLTQIPAFPTIVGTLAKILTFALPISAVSWIARVVARVPPHVAQAAAEFLKGPHAVQQAMHMLRDECREIKEDTWTEEIWGSPEPTPNKTVPLKLYFAKNDNWVSNQARDALIASRGRTENAPWKPEMIIDENNISHGFNESIGDSKLIAKKVADLVESFMVSP